MSKTYSVDANIILRYLTRDHEELWKKADAIVGAMDDGKVELVCDPVTLAEVVFVLGSTYGLAREQIHALMEPIVTAKAFVMPNKEVYIRALELYGDSVSHFGDACACATALARAEGRLVSFDKKLSGVEGIHRTEEV